MCVLTVCKAFELDISGALDALSFRVLSTAAGRRDVQCPDSPAL